MFYGNNNSIYLLLGTSGLNPNSLPGPDQLQPVYRNVGGYQDSVHSEQPRHCLGQQSSGRRLGKDEKLAKEANLPFSVKVKIITIYYFWKHFINYCNFVTSVFNDVSFILFCNNVFRHLSACQWMSLTTCSARRSWQRTSSMYAGTSGGEGRTRWLLKIVVRGSLNKLRNYRSNWNELLTEETESSMNMAGRWIYKQALKSWEKLSFMTIWITV